MGSEVIKEIRILYKFEKLSLNLNSLFSFIFYSLIYHSFLKLTSRKHKMTRESRCLAGEPKHFPLFFILIIKSTLTCTSCWKILFSGDFIRKNRELYVNLTLLASFFRNNLLENYRRDILKNWIDVAWWALHLCRQKFSS